MKRLSFLIESAVIIMFIFNVVSCKHNKEQPECGDPAPNIFNLVLKDKNDSLVIGKEYNQDTVKLTVNKKKADFFIYNGVISVHYDTLQPYNTDEYILYLRESDQDTLNLIITTHTPSECPKFLKLDSLYYNHKFIPSNKGDLTFKILKQ